MIYFESFLSTKRRFDATFDEHFHTWLAYQSNGSIFPATQLDFRTPPGFDRTRNAEIGNKDIKFKHLEEAFTSEHWLVRIYKVKKLDNREPLDHKLRSVVPKQKYTSKKVPLMFGGEFALQVWRDSFRFC